MKYFSWLIILTLFFSCKSPENQYTKDSPEIEYCLALLSYYNTFNFKGIKEIYSDTVKIYENNLEPYDVERLLASLKSSEFNLEYQRLNDTVNIEMIVNDKGEKWVYARYIWKIKYINAQRELKIPVHSSWQFVENKIVKDYTYYDSKNFDHRFDSIPLQ